ncbi:MAG: FecR family protein [Prevotella sp.]
MDKKDDRYELPNDEQQTEIAEAFAHIRHDAPDVDLEWEKMERQMGTSHTWRQRVVLGLVAAAACLLCLLLLNTNKGTDDVAPEGAIVVARNGAMEIVVDNGNGNGNEMTIKGNKYAAVATKTVSPRTTTITTPRGKDCNITLPDGSRVWLNADSRLSFPETFTGEKRKVELKGEAYFEVTHDAMHPFVVETEYLTTRVLGTVFNVRAFSAKDAQVVLVDGKVDVGGCLLHPGQTAFVSKGEIKTAEIDTYPFTQRKEGFFYFHDAPLVQIMGEIGRWYNKTIVFENQQMLNIRLHFVAERNLLITDILKQLDSIDGVGIAQEKDGTVVVKRLKVED